ncbi:MAG TPA: hypothetical protein VLF60_03880 [Candidatus Saccharimonadales bacterium]|nr:hypothetical protein [Candidatus Saccharimonadales bacterium]
MDQKLVAIWQDPAKELSNLVLNESLARSHMPVLEKVPLISLAVAAWKTGHAWGDYLLAKKVCAFYEGWEHLTAKERHEIFEKFQRRPRDFVEKLLGLLSTQEDLSKCRLIGLLCAQYLQATLQRSVFYDLIETIDQLSVSDIAKFAQLARLSIFLPQQKLTERYTYLFIGRGLLETDKPPLGTYDQEQSATMYKLTELGQTLAKAAKTAGFLPQEGRRR